MFLFLAAMGLLGIIVSVIILIIFGVQRKPLKIPFIVLILSPYLILN
jgi:hypothetical protein